MAKYVVCSEAQLATIITTINDPGSYGFTVNQQAIFVVRRGENLFFYRNSCPHLGVELEWVENQFLDTDESLIQCATHGALFVIDSGECVYGPCIGQKLEALAHEIKDGNVLVELSDSPQQPQA